MISVFTRRYTTQVIGALKNAINTGKIDYDVIISGGGMIGTTLACALAKNPLLKNTKILLIERSPKMTYSKTEKYSNRVSSLNPATKKLLESLGIWEHIASVRFRKVKQMKVWGSGSEAAIDFKSGDSDVAYIVENNLLVSAVDNELVKLKENVTVLNGQNATGYDLPAIDSSFISPPVNVRMEDGKSYGCKLLLGTDGFNSKVRQSMNIQYLSWKYNQAAIVATLTLDKVAGRTNDTAWQRFLPTGPIALLPLTDELSSLVWTMTPEMAKSYLQVPSQEFVAALNNAFKDPPKSNSLIEFASKAIEFATQSINIASYKAEAPIPPQIVSVDDGSRAMFPLGFGHATSYVKPGVALLGDAAHRVHPLAGQGVNLGFGDISCLVNVLAEGVATAKPLNRYTLLLDYESSRQRHNIPTMLAIDFINKVYSSSNTALTAAGDLAIQLTNAVNPLKSLMMKQASS